MLPDGLTMSWAVWEEEASYNQPQGVVLAAERSLTHEAPALSYHIYGAVPTPLAGLGQVITQKPLEGS